MVVEYMLLLLISSMILVGAFGFSTGPVGMFKKNSPFLAHHVQESLETGKGFEEKANRHWQ